VAVMLALPETDCRDWSVRPPGQAGYRVSFQGWMSDEVPGGRECGEDGCAAAGEAGGRSEEMAFTRGSCGCTRSMNMSRNASLFVVLWRTLLTMPTRLAGILGRYITFWYAFSDEFGGCRSRLGYHRFRGFVNRDSRQGPSPDSVGFGNSSETSSVRVGPESHSEGSRVFV